MTQHVATARNVLPQMIVPDHTVLHQPPHTCAGVLRAQLVGVLATLAPAAEKPPLDGTGLSVPSSFDVLLSETVAVEPDGATAGFTVQVPPSVGLTSCASSPCAGAACVRSSLMLTSGDTVAGRSTGLFLLMGPDTAGDSVSGRGGGPGSAEAGVHGGLRGAGLPDPVVSLLLPLSACKTSCSGDQGFKRLVGASKGR